MGNADDREPAPIAHLHGDLDEFAVGTPNCPTCLVPVQPDGEGAALDRRCTKCGIVRL